jgi:hypothetical protein
MKYIKRFNENFDEDDNYEDDDNYVDLDWIEDTGDTWHKSSIIDIKAAIDEIHSLGVLHPLMRGSYMIGNVVIDISCFDGHLCLNDILTTERARGKGEASIVLRKICDIADKHNVYMSTTPKAFGQNKGLTTHQLRDWYLRFGFDNIVNGNMERKPKSLN